MPKITFEFTKDKTIWSIFFAGIIILIILYFLAPDKSEQIYKTLTLIAVLLIFLPIILIALKYYMEQKRS